MEDTSPGEDHPMKGKEGGPPHYGGVDFYQKRRVNISEFYVSSF